MVALIKWATTRIAPTFLSLPRRSLILAIRYPAFFRGCGFDFLKKHIRMFFKFNVNIFSERIQSYSDETGSIWEDVKFGFIYGSQSFIDRIKDKYLSDKPDDNFPQLNQFLRSQDPNEILKKAEDILGSKIVDYKKARRLRGHERDKRDIIVWLL